MLFNGPHFRQGIGVKEKIGLPGKGNKGKKRKNGEEKYR
jgi:hypothetical protein